MTAISLRTRDGRLLRWWGRGHVVVTDGFDGPEVSDREAGDLYVAAAPGVPGQIRAEFVFLPDRGVMTLNVEVTRDARNADTCWQLHDEDGLLITKPLRVQVHRGYTVRINFGDALNRLLP